MLYVAVGHDELSRRLFNPVCQGSALLHAVQCLYTLPHQENKIVAPAATEAYFLMQRNFFLIRMKKLAFLRQVEDN